MTEILNKAAMLVDRFGGTYELFTSVDDVKNYIGDTAELDDTIPEIWRKRIEACESILAENALPCIFDTTAACVVCRIAPDGFYFDGKHYGND